MEFDHYRVLGLPSGDEGAKLTPQDITTAFRKRAVVLHPDKRPNDRNACAEFIALKNSYDILNDPIKRQVYDARNSNCHYRSSKNQQEDVIVKKSSEERSQRREKTTPTNEDFKLREKLDKIQITATKIVLNAKSNYQRRLGEKKISRLKSRIGTWKTTNPVHAEEIRKIIISLDAAMEALKFKDLATNYHASFRFSYFGYVNLS